MKNSVMDRSYAWVIGVVVVVLAIVAGYSFMKMPDDRNPGQKISDAIRELPQGADKAVRELEDRTPGQKLGDAVKDTGDRIKENTSP